MPAVTLLHGYRYIIIYRRINRDTHPAHSNSLINPHEEFYPVNACPARSHRSIVCWPERRHEKSLVRLFLYLHRVSYNDRPRHGRRESSQNARSQRQRAKVRPTVIRYSRREHRVMEGPSLVLLKEELQPFIGKKIEKASGLARIDHHQLVGQKITDFKSWGKHFLVVLQNVAIRIHFLMFGSYRINERKETEPRLRLEFGNGQEIGFYTTAVALVTDDLDDVYDWSTDVMSDAWDPAKARRKLRKLPDVNVGDALLDQNIFSGVGNIIKNEVLFRIHVHPESVIGGLPAQKLSALVREARLYSFDFYEWKKAFRLKKHWLIHTKPECPRCKIPSIKRYTGLKKRRSFFCDNCQILYSH